jgi:NAD(P)-dependent dehydrogenase (short-subunit alcohol dehydrogenase family)
MKKLSGKIAVVTGGSTGIGLATARRFVAEGAHVYITGRRQRELDAAVRSIGDNVTAVRGDVADLADLDRLYATVKENHGRVDVLFANAGGAEAAPLGQITEGHYDKWFGVNVKGLLFTVQKALPLMPDGAAIILNASIVSILGMPGLSVYSATKAAVRSFARTWTMDLKDRRIRVNALSPGPVDTPAVDNLAGSKEAKEQFKREVTPQIPLGRWGETDEIAAAAVFLASGDSSYVTGVELYVDGGMSQV